MKGLRATAQKEKLRTDGGTGACSHDSQKKASKALKNDGNFTNKNGGSISGKKPETQEKKKKFRQEAPAGGGNKLVA